MREGERRSRKIDERNKKKNARMSLRECEVRE